MGNLFGNLAALVVIVIAAVLSSVSFRTSAFTLTAAAYGFFLLFWLGDVRMRPPRYEQFWRLLSEAEFAALRKYHLFLRFPFSGHALSAFLNLLRLAAIVWGVISLWKAEYWLGAALLAHPVIVGFLCLRFDPIRYMIGAAQKGNDVAREQLMLIERVRELSPDL